MALPLVSVIMPSFNAERYIAEALDSVLAQTVEDLELIVVDDGSTDATAAVAAARQRRDPRIRLFPQKANRGPAHARNVGIDHARGEMIAFIDSDDAWRPEKTEKQVAAMERCRADICYTGYERRHEERQRVTVVSVPASVQYRTLLGHNPIACSTAMVRKATCGAVRMPLLRLQQDHGYWLELLRAGRRTAVGVNEPLASYRVRRGSLSANKLAAAFYSWKLFREVERLPRVESLRIFTAYAFHHLKLGARARWSRSSRPPSPSAMR